MYLLAAFSRYPDFGENTEFVVFGFAFVVFVLLALAVLTAAIGVLFKRLDAAAKNKQAAIAAAAPAPVSQPASPETQQSDGNIPFLVTAAVAAVMDGQAHRIVSVKPRGEGWAQEGRRQIFSSHRVR